MLYNKPVDKISSFENFLKMSDNNKNVRLMILDNSSSEKQQANESFCRNYYEKIIYLSNNGNVGLSRAYNKALQTIQDEDYWVMLSDDDTFFSSEYLNNLLFHISEKTSQIITGIVKADGKVLSPIKKLGIRIEYKNFIFEKGLYKNIYCINSGLAFNCNLIKKVGYYNEKLFLDMVDHYFMELLIENNCNYVQVIDGNIEQNFSGTLSTSKENTLKRFNIYKKDFITFCNLTQKSLFFKYTILVKRFINVYLRLLLKGYQFRNY